MNTKNELNVYGYCPICGAEGVERERRINGNDKCRNGHIYPSSSALKSSAKPSRQGIDPDKLDSWANDQIFQIKEESGKRYDEFANGAITQMRFLLHALKSGSLDYGDDNDI